MSKVALASALDLARSSTRSRFRLGYRPELDGLRGIAVILVMLSHSGIARGGFIGVDIFFVLSGFLITALLLEEYDREGHVNLKKFYIRRALRLLPALYLLLAVFAVFALVTKQGHDLTKAARSALFCFLYVADYAKALGFTTLGELGHIWSLAVEEQFYLVWPLLLICMLKLVSRRKTLGVIVLLIAGIAVQRSLLWDGSEQKATRISFAFDTRMDALLVGCAIGLLAEWGHLAVSRGGVRLLRALGLVCIAPLAVKAASNPGILDSRGLAYTSLLIQALLIGVVVAGVLVSPQTKVVRVLKIPALVWVGRVSYGLYLWHYLIVSVLKTLSLRYIVMLLMYFPLTVLATASSFYLLETPCLKAKKRLG